MTASFAPTIMQAVRDRFAHVDECPYQGQRVFFENAGGALTLKSVVETSNRHAGLPDNPGRINPAGQATQELINKAKSDWKTFLGASSGQVFMGESGTELIFRTIMNACLETPEGSVIGTSLEHPATRSACTRWAKVAGKPYTIVPHNNETGTVTAADYAAMVTTDTQVATVVHTSPVTGMGVDIKSIVEAVRAVAPNCYFIVDGIQHAAHGGLDIDSYDIDAYVVSPYKVFSRHGYGVAWISDRLTDLPHDSLNGAPEGNWELGTRDAGAYACMIDVVDYFSWLGTEVGETGDQRAKIIAGSKAIHDHEQALCEAMINGTGNLKGLRQMEGVSIIGGWDNPAREGLVAINVDGIEAADLVATLNAKGIRTHVRKADHYSGNVLDPLGLEACVRVSMCHYNSHEEVAQFLAVMQELTG